MTDRRWWWCVLAIAVIAVLARAAARWAGGAYDLQTWEYDWIARNVRAGHGYGMEYRAAWYHTIGSAPYTYLAVVLYWLFGLRQWPLEIVQWLFAAAGVVGAGLLAARLFSPRVGLVGAALVAAHPALVLYDVHNLHPLGFDAALVVWSIVMLVFVVANASPAVIVVAGL